MIHHLQIKRCLMPLIIIHLMGFVRVTTSIA